MSGDRPGRPAARSVRDSQQTHWNAVAGGWARWFEWTERNFSPLTAWLRGAAGWQPGARILDVACGAGYPALAAAASVRPHGRVVATDISPEMIAEADRRATALGLDTIEFRERDAEQLGFDTGTFDAVMNAYGLMFCPDPGRAVAEAWRVLARGGALAVVTWDEPSRNPFFTTILGVAARFLGLPPPDPTAPGPFRLADPAALDSLLRASGFTKVTIDRLEMTFECGSAAEYVDIFSDVAWKARIASLGADEAARFRAAVAEATPSLEDGRLRLGTTSLCASGRK